MSESSPYRWVEAARVTHRTRFPFKATINGEEVVVWPDWIERIRDPDDAIYDAHFDELEEENG